MATHSSVLAWRIPGTGVQQCVHVHSKFPNYPFPLATVSSFSKSVSLFLFCKLSSFLSFLFRFHILGMPYNISPSLLDLFHSVRQSLGLSMLLHMALFYSFYWLSNIPLYIFFIQPSISGHLSSTV